MPATLSSYIYVQEWNGHLPNSFFFADEDNTWIQSRASGEKESVDFTGFDFDPSSGEFKAGFLNLQCDNFSQKGLKV